MRYGEPDQDGVAWTDAERRELRALPMERTPSALLLARTLTGLRQRALVEPELDLRLREARRRRRGSLALAAIAATLLAFVAGGALGYELALRHAAPHGAVPRLAAQSVPDSARAPVAESDRHVVWF